MNRHNVQESNVYERSTRTDFYIRAVVKRLNLDRVRASRRVVGIVVTIEQSCQVSRIWLTPPALPQA